MFKISSLGNLGRFSKEEGTFKLSEDEEKEDKKGPRLRSL